MRTLLFVIDGFEEIEALATVDILRRAGIPVQTVSLTDSPVVTGGHQIPVTADLMFAEADMDEADFLIIPGGTTAFNDHEGLKAQLLAHHAQDKHIAAICAAPMVLGGLGILDGKQATCYPGFEQYLDGAELQAGVPVVVDGKIITGYGPGLALAFALQLVEIIAGKAKRDEISAQLLLD